MKVRHWSCFSGVFFVGGLAHGCSLRPPRAAIGAFGRDTLRGQSWRAGVLQAAGPEIAGPGCRIAEGNRRPKRNKMKKSRINCIKNSKSLYIGPA